MKPFRHMLLAIAGSIVALTPTGTRAQDASFGCKILLCVASQNPSWQGVSYCVPPVLKLLAIRKVHPGYWPSCPEAGTHKPGYAEFEDCPAGTTPTTINRASDHGGSTRGTPACAKPVQAACSSLYNRNDRLGSNSYRDNAGSQRVGDACTTTEIIPRPRRRNPYYFDIRNEGAANFKRVYFNLRH
ncbi:hypothetical protein [Mesorhizobium denitrificans]|uniref:hypothetical protein n=1 Tax=Mesorhizobium denitrificans TaxID=2294114 RepID=UPI0011C05A54|nr:hypothetical protein [Mesorhizobium denitrificans]